MRLPLLSYQGYAYGYGAAGIPLVLPVSTDKTRLLRSWFYNPVFIGLLFSVLIMWLIRSCVTPATRPSSTVLWVHRAPEIPEQVVVAQPPPPIVAGEVEEAKAEVLPEPPQLMTRKEVREKPMMLKKPDPIPLPDRPVSTEMQKRVALVDREMIRQETKSAPPPVAAAQAVRSQMQRPENRVVYDQESAMTITPAEIPTRPVQSRAESPSRPAVNRMATADFTPLSLSAGAEKPAPSSPAESRMQSPALVAGGKKIVAAQGGGGVSRPLAASSDRAYRPGGDNVIAAGPQFSPDLPVVNAPAMSPGGGVAEVDRVTITGLVTGEYSRVQNLKRMILQKARDMKPGVYCCLIQDVRCRIQVSGDETIAISFSRDGVAFDIVSRLERLLPGGVTPCAE